MLYKGEGSPLLISVAEIIRQMPNRDKLFLFTEEEERETLVVDIFIFENIASVERTCSSLYYSSKVRISLLRCRLLGKKYSCFN